MREYRFHSKEEKLTIVKRYLAGESPNKLYKETVLAMEAYENGDDNI